MDPTYQHNIQQGALETRRRCAIKCKAPLYAGHRCSPVPCFPNLPKAALSNWHDPNICLLPGHSGVPSVRVHSADAVLQVGTAEDPMRPRTKLVLEHRACERARTGSHPHLPQLHWQLLCTAGADPEVDLRHACSTTRPAFLQSACSMSCSWMLVACLPLPASFLAGPLRPADRR